jgi:hypothetical protein
MGKFASSTTKIIASTSIVVGESQHVDCKEGQEDVSGFEGKEAVGSKLEESPTPRDYTPTASSSSSEDGNIAQENDSVLETPVDTSGEPILQHVPHFSALMH